MDHFKQVAIKLRDDLNAKILGQELLVDQCLCALFGGGHLLMTGAPGLAKTSLVRDISDKLGLSFGRIQ
ncbi:MAG: AAA family ATPase, partial [Zetaproteobacteria bacterium]|nr:AAA family ATPase [Zetaproteobacteria bacterium]